MVFIMLCEEIYWQQRGSQTWIEKGDLNTAYFQAVANGRRRRCNIVALRDGPNNITEHEALQRHIYSFYRELLASGERGGAKLVVNALGGGGVGV